MADIPFAVGGSEIRCPDFDKSDFSELGDIEYEYLDGSPVYLGMPSITYVWPNLLDGEVQLIRELYRTRVTNAAVTGNTGVTVSLTIPDYAHGGLKLSTAFMLEPVGTAAGDGSTNVKVTFTHVSIGALETAFEAVSGNLWDGATHGWNYLIGQSNDQDTGWQFG